MHDATAGGGKSGIGWELLAGTSRDGIKTAYVDLEYAGAFAPTPVDDPGNHRLKIGLLAAMWPAYQSDGVRCLVAFTSTSVADVADVLRETIPDSVVTTCRADHGETAKTRPDSVADVYIDTTGLDFDEVAERSAPLPGTGRSATWSDRSDVLACFVIRRVRLLTAAQPA